MSTLYNIIHQWQLEFSLKQLLEIFQKQVEYSLFIDI